MFKSKEHKVSIQLLKETEVRHIERGIRGKYVLNFSFDSVIHDRRRLSIGCAASRRTRMKSWRRSTEGPHGRAMKILHYCFKRYLVPSLPFFVQNSFLTDSLSACELCVEPEPNHVTTQDGQALQIRYLLTCKLRI